MRSASEVVNQFDLLQRQIAASTYAESIMTWDAQTVAPRDSVRLAGEVASYITDLISRLYTSEDTVKLVQELQALSEQGLLSSKHQQEFTVFKRQFCEYQQVPSRMLSDFQRLLNNAYPVWKDAKLHDDYESFAPWVKKIFSSMREQAHYMNPDKDPYDVWLDHFDRGTTSAILDSFFEQVKEEIVPLAHEILSRGKQPEISFLFNTIPIEKQKILADDLAKLIGLDMNRFAFGLTEHPFTIGISREDVRVAHHFHERDVIAGVYTTIHEGGHSLYEQNVNPDFDFTCLSGGTSAGIHESQSRLMENNVGRSRPFMDALLPLLKKASPETFDGVTADQLYHAVNVVKPTFIRTEADELTYTLHIMVRYEVERRLMDEEISAEEAPELWNSLTKDYLGIEVPNNKVGILQDMHWAIGDVGYFASYGIGNAYAAQFVAHARKDAQMAGIDVDERISQGDLTPITGWLKEHIWQYGKSLDPQEIIVSACGEAFDASYYVKYLTDKYRNMYRL